MYYKNNFSLINRVLNQFQGFIKTPSIFRNHEIFDLSLFNADLEVSNNASDSIDISEISKNTVLGKRVEYFFKVAVQANENFTLLTNNIQIHNGERTLGELDFIIKDHKKNQILHVELMYKFYVYDPEIPAEMERWIGPNRKDTLLKKIEKVKTNQFPLLYTTEAEEYLKSLNINSKDIQQEICFKATLFVPENLFKEEFPNINKHCIAGFWFHLKDFSKYNQIGFQFFAPEKQDWPINPKYGEEWFSFKEIFEQLNNLHRRKKSPLLWIKKPDGSFERLIVVWW